MAAYDRFLIAPLNEGLQTDVRPWLISDQAFAQLRNAYNFRGRIRKRFGSRLMNTEVDNAEQPLLSRFRINLGSIPGGGILVGVVPGAIFKVGQLFSVNATYLTVVTAGVAQPLNTTGAETGTYSTTNGAFSITGTLGDDVFFYPAEPVMGLPTYETAAINDEPLYGFDTQFSYTYVSGAWTRVGTGAVATWTGDDSDFFWATTYRGDTAYENFMFVTNFNTPDLMRYFDGSTWNFFNPVYDSTTGLTIKTARIIVPFKDRLILLNTVEDVPGNQSFVNRCRFSQDGSPVAVDAFYDDVSGKGGYIDAPTKEAIVTAQFLKDRLIVFFESSTWELVFTGNQILPFRWQQINTELGCESTFSQVPFDKVILGIGNVGVHACNGANVERIDEKIPDAVFQIHNDNQGVFRVAGIRDYYLEMVYWTFPDETNDPTFPTRVLVYNYRTSTWAFNDDSITAFGYFQNENSLTWEAATILWQDDIDQWNAAPLQARFRNIVAGNQEGFTFIIDPDSTRNAAALQITNISYVPGIATITAIDHNLYDTDYVLIEDCLGVTGLNGQIFKVVPKDPYNEDEFDVILPAGLVLTGIYSGQGTIARVSKIDILTKQYNFYVKEGMNLRLSRVDFQVDRTANGEIQIDCFVSTSEQSMTQEGEATGSLIGNNVLTTKPYDLVPFEKEAARLWHRVFIRGQGEFVQLRIYLNDEQMRNVDIATSEFELHALILHAMRTSSNLQ